MESGEFWTAGEISFSIMGAVSLYQDRDPSRLAAGLSKCAGRIGSIERRAAPDQDECQYIDKGDRGGKT
jgi:hypothetical protein